MKNNLKKNFIWNALGSTINAFNSLFFMIIVTRINGVDDAGIFTFAFSLGLLLYVIGVYSGRTYQVTDEENGDSDYIYAKIITCVAMMLVAFLFCFVRGYNVYKFTVIILLALFKMLEALSESFYAIMQKKEELYKAGISIFLKSLVSVIIFLIVDLITKNMIVSIISIVIINLLGIVFYDLLVLRQLKFKLLNIDKKKIISILKGGFYAFGFTFLSLYVINAPKYSIDMLLTEKYQTIFGIIIMPSTMIVLLCQYITQPFITTMQKIKDSSHEYRKFVGKLILVIIGLGIIIVLCAYLLGIPILELLYGLELDIYLSSLIVIIIGSIFYSIVYILSTALTTKRITFLQFVVYLITSVFALIISHYLVLESSINGAFYAYLLIMMFLSTLYVAVFLYKTKGEEA